jgi:probable rRNA maturation factor
MLLKPRRLAYILDDGMKPKEPSLYVAVTSRTRSMRTPRKKIYSLVEFIAFKADRPIHDVDIAVVDSREMGKFNRKYLGHSGTTDVISFDLSEDPKGPLSAQIIVCGQVAVRESEKRKHGVQRELLLYVTHGLLHLLGYDDVKAADAAEMYLRQDELLEDFMVHYRAKLREERDQSA